MSLVKPPILVPGLKSRIARHGPLLFTLFCGALAAAPLFSNTGFLMTRGGGDSPFLLLRLHQLLAALSAGEFPARWMPDAAYGYGFPFFSYYAALPYYLAALLRAYGFSYVTALKLTQLGALLAAAAGLYAWARVLPPEGWSRPRALLAAAAYSFAPFHLVNLYVRGDSLSELWAMAFYPWVLWGLQRCLARPGLGRALALALLTGGLVLSHNISALNFMPFAGLYALLAAWSQFRRCRAASGAPLACARPGVTALLALAWGLGLAAFFWLPALRETGAVQIGEVTEGYFFYGNHFRAANLVQTSLFYGAETGVSLPTPFAMGLAQAVAGALGLAAWLWGAARARRWTATDTFLLAGLLLSTWMITPYSSWAWEHLPLVSFSQFPWRFLSIQALFVAAITAHLVPAGARPAAWPRWAMAGGVALALALFGLGGLRPDFVPVRDADVTAERLQLLEYFSANIGSTIGYEYLPSAVEPRPFVSAQVLRRSPELKALEGTATGARLRQRGSRQTWTVDVTEGPAVIALPTYYWPGWTGRVDGQPAPLGVKAGLGWITLAVPEGAHTVTLTLGRTPLRAAAEAASALLLLGPLALLAYRQRGRWARRQALPTRALAITLGALALGAVALRVVPGAPPAGPLSMDFVQAAFPHAAPVPFANGAVLRGVEYSTDTPKRGSTLTVRSRWQNDAPAEVVFELQPASNLLNAAPVVLASAMQPLATGATVLLEHTLTVPEDIPPGAYFMTVIVSAAGQTQPALTHAGRERGRVYLAPLVIDDPRIANANEALQDFGPAIELLAATLAPTGPEGARLSLLWRARQSVPGNYLLAVRLRDVGGLEWSGVDAQTAYGFYPTHLWRAGEVVPDFYGLPLEPGTPPGDYELTLELRDPGTGSSLGSVQVTRALTGATPAGERQPRFTLLPELALTEVGFPARIEQGEAPELRAGWLTLGRPAEDYRARWTLTPLDNSSGQAPVTRVLDLAPGSAPSRWPAGAYVLGRVRLGTAPTLAPGIYAVSVRLEDTAGTLVGEAADVGRLEVTGRARSFAAPPMQTEVGATFGDRIKLWGYDAERDDGALRLTLVWGALEAPGRDYKFFVHLFNEADGFVAAQVDAMPRDFTYPTALWVAGEVVSDTVTLSLADLPPGRYGVAVGWYDPNVEGLPRLEAVDAAGAVLADGRVVLGEEVIGK